MYLFFVKAVVWIFFSIALVADAATGVFRVFGLSLLPHLLLLGRDLIFNLFNHLRVHVVCDHLFHSFFGGFLKDAGVRWVMLFRRWWLSLILDYWSRFCFWLFLGWGLAWHATSFFYFSFYRCISSSFLNLRCLWLRLNLSLYRLWRRWCISLSFLNPSFRLWRWCQRVRSCLRRCSNDFFAVLLRLVSVVSASRENTHWGHTNNILLWYQNRWLNFRFSDVLQRRVVIKPLLLNWVGPLPIFLCLDHEWRELRLVI